MAKALTYGQAARVLHNAGFGKGSKSKQMLVVHDLAVAVAIATAESGRVPDKVSPINHDGSHDVGLMQINSVHGHSDDEMKNPRANAEVAYGLFLTRANHNDAPYWKDWTTFNRKLHIPYLPAAMLAARAELKMNPDNLTDMGDAADWTSETNPVQIVGGAVNAGVNAAGAAVDGVMSVGHFLGMLADRDTWIRVAEVFFGGIFLLAGLALLAKELGAANTATQIVKAAPVGKVVKAATKVAK